MLILSPGRWSTRPAWWPITPTDVWANAERLGIDPASIAGLYPYWEGAGAVRGALGDTLPLGSGCSWSPHGVSSDGTANGRMLDASYSPLATSDGAGTGDFSALIWTSRTDTTRRAAITCRAGSGQYHWEIRLNAGAAGAAVVNSIAFLTGAGGAYTEAYGTSPAGTGDRFFAGVREGSTVSLYEDAQLIDSNTGTVRDVYNPATQGFAIHGLPDSTAIPHNGLVRQVILANSALSADQLQALWAQPYALLQPGPRLVVFDLAAGNVTVQPASATHGHSADQAAITPAANLAPADGTHAHTAGEPTLSTGTTVQPASGTHGHSAEAPAITPAANLAPADGTHAHTAGEPTLSTGTTVQPASGTHGHTAEAPAITPAANLAPADGTHPHTAGEPTLTTGTPVQPDSTTHGHTAEAPAITPAANLAPADASHTHTAGEPSLTTGAGLGPLTDPTLASVTLARTLASLTVTRTIHPL